MAKKSKKLINKILPKAETEKVIPVKKTKIRVIGIGGGGGNIVSELAQRVRKASFLVANTDLQALKEVSKKVERFPFGQVNTGGLGTGMKPEIAEIASQNEKERIKKILQDQDLVIFIACLGGGTGSGAAPIFAKICQSLGKLSYGIFTLPFKFEGEKKMEIAKRALEILRPKLNAVTVLPNERIFQIIDKATPLKEAFSAVNKSLAQSLEGLIETIYQPGLINIDFADLRTILEGRGRLAYLNTLSFSRKEGAVREAAEKVLTSPLYPYSIEGAKGVLFNIVGQKDLSLEEISQISKTISEKVNSEAKIIFGIQPLSFKREESGCQNIIKATVFATGLSAKIFAKEIEKPKRNLLTETRRKDMKKITLPQEQISKPNIKEVKKSKPRKTKIKVIKELEKKPKVSSEIEVKEVKKENLPTSEGKIEVKIRKNTLQVKKEIEEEERKILEKEKFWESPAFLRKKLIRGQ